MILIYLFRALGWLLKKIPWGAPFRKGNGKRTFKILLVLFGLGIVSSIGLIAWASKDLPDPNKLTDRQIAQSTKIYDRTGEHILYEVFEDQKRTLITLDELPDYLVQGVIATEDTKFYEHHGIRPLSIIRAVVYGLLPGKKIEGTSTLTQQLVKNAILTSERRYSRKLKEFILSIRLEQVYTKDQILQIYFNEIPYGSTNYGVESASQSYFGKSASDLTLAEAATLAGLPQQPSRFLNDLDRLKERRNFVLRRMSEEGYITEAEKTAAQAEPLNLDVSYSNIDAPHFVLYVKEKLVEDYGEQMVDTGGLKVITSLDWDKQHIAEQVIDEVGTPKLAEAGANNTSLVAMDPKTGHILAMVGSKDYYDDSIKGQFNVATLGKRQPGSSFKPIIYAAAFEKGYTPNTILYDVLTNFASSGKSYTPKNYDLSEHGPVTMRQALQGSLNIPAVKTLYLVGEQKGVDFAERLGYTTLGEGDFGLSLVLGGGEVLLIDHVGAYATFANE
ncbi:MAG: penicillin-binding protein, 1A family, partial [uncultured bacterium]